MTLRSRLSVAAIAVAASLLVAACGAAATPAPSLPTPVVVTPAPSPSPSTPVATPTAAPSAPAPAVEAVALEVVAEGLASPLFATHAGDGSGRLFVVEQGGTIRALRDGRLLPEPFLDIRDRVAAGGERGLLGLAFAPTFSDDGRFYVDYTDRDGNTVVAELRAPDPAADRADPGSERVLLRIEQPFANHNGGALAIGPDGFLWIATGDGGSGGDPQGNGQRLDTLLGKLLRIDPRPSGGAPYGIPADNPFVGRADARGEIWAFGLRNPWRFSFDQANGDLWVGDVGQGSFEEVNHWPAGSPAGPNFGWNTMEASACYSPAEGCVTDGLVLPVAEYGHDRGCSVTGGYVYRGTGVPGLAGTYLYGDFCSGTIWGLAAETSGTEPGAAPRVLLESGVALASFGEDEAGELYVLDLAGGRLHRVVAAQ